MIGAIHYQHSRGKIELGFDDRIWYKDLKLDRHDSLAHVDIGDERTFFLNRFLIDDLPVVMARAEYPFIYTYHLSQLLGDIQHFKIVIAFLKFAINYFNRYKLKDFGLLFLDYYANSNFNFTSEEFRLFENELTDLYRKIKPPVKALLKCVLHSTLTKTTDLPRNLKKCLISFQTGSVTIPLTDRDVTYAKTLLKLLKLIHYGDIEFDYFDEMPVKKRYKLRLYTDARACIPYVRAHSCSLLAIIAITKTSAKCHPECPSFSLLDLLENIKTIA